MDTVQTQIREWLWGQQDWLQDAAHRLLTKGSISDDEIGELAKSLKSKAGQSSNRDRSFNELVDSTTSSSHLRLIRLSNVRGIESLAPRRPLDFGTESLVVIYGHNGAGKSGYTRLLKRVSGKPRAAILRTNIFEDPAIDRGCQITIRRADKEEVIDWHPDDAPVDMLRGLDIFDTDEATQYLSKENAASYSHPMLAMFEALASICDRIKGSLQGEQDALVSSLPRVPTTFLGTSAGKAYLGLTARASQAQVANLKAWTERDQLALELLRGRLAQVDPASIARQKRNTKQQAEKIIVAVRREVEAYGKDGIESVRSLRSDAKVKRKAAQDAGLLSSSKLEGIGSDSWIRFWQAARTYSEIAYQSAEFPVTEAGSLCIFCHQELSAEAGQRLQDFDQFVEGALAAEADAAEQVYRTCLMKLPAAKDEEAVRTQCEAAGVTRPELVKSLVRFWARASVVRTCLLDEEFEENAEPLGVEDLEIAEIQRHCAELDEQAIQCDVDASGEQRPQLELQRLELEARLWVSQQATAIDDEVMRLKTSKNFDDWKSLSNSRKVTIKASEISAKVVTEEYVRRFNSELQALGASRLKVELVKTRAERGKTLHKIQLVGARQAGGIELILSEGERRVVSLAAFLADVAVKPESTPFVFDDPISSLDQTWEELTASRLVSLSQSRQVIVFTHRLSMLSQLSDSAQVVHIRVEPWGAGETGEVPLFGKSPEKALNDVKGRRLAQAKRLLDTAGSEAYYPLAKSICSDFRIIIERFVETYVLAEVVQRHRREVNTKGKLQNLLKLRKEDCNMINELMSKYSKFEHSQSHELPVELPAVDELARDMQILLDWHAEFKGRAIPVP